MWLFGFTKREAPAFPLCGLPTILSIGKGKGYTLSAATKRAKQADSRALGGVRGNVISDLRAVITSNEHGQETISDAAECTAVTVTGGSEPSVLLMTSRIVLHAGARPMIEGISESRVAAVCLKGHQRLLYSVRNILTGSIRTARMIAGSVAKRVAMKIVSDGNVTTAKSVSRT